MKTKILTLLMICGLCKAQITLENSYQATSQSLNLSINEFVKYGYKYQLLDYVQKNVKLYNMNHSIFKSISLPVPTGANLYVVNVSDSLYNTDNLIEVGYSYYATSATQPTWTSEAKVIDETGTVLISIPSGRYMTPASAGINGYKLIVNVDSTNKPSLKEINVYSLVGGLPVHIKPASNPGNPTGVPSQKETNFISGPVPNPSNGKAVIAYQIPQGQNSSEILIYNINGQEVKRYQVDNAFNTLELDNSDLPSGTYLYQMTGSSEAKKLVIIK